MGDPQPVTIIMIEDDPGHARLIEKSIRRAGIANGITHFDNGTAALEFLGDGTVLRDQGGPVLILLDLNLTDMKGVDILARIKERPPLSLMPVIVLTTTDDKQEVARCYELGCNVYITKPLNYDSFSDAIRQLGLFLSVMQLPVLPV
ncbi:CheY-like chemotaxis protein [Novosphingobium sp. SG751A]|uniref:response regulator n=1 Tax=Novosphingobium sp. SG751A TaxID=2587000 RepID=UPI0015551F79|nr:response regulator [Novosphingobium sp. SG751A]NOW46366.1 CheY-like chemotaxis protein [Novosphingobium sp. SG751A]